MGEIQPFVFEPDPGEEKEPPDQVHLQVDASEW